MPRRLPKRPTNGQAIFRAPSEGHSRAIVLVDGTRIRKKIKKDYEKALRDLANSRQKLDQFHQTDLPQFTRWYNMSFGALLTELRRLNQQMAADAQLIMQVENEAMFGRCSDAYAYQRVMERLENPEPPPPTGDDEREGEENSRGPRPESGNYDGEDDPVDDFFKTLYEEFGPEEDHRGKSGPGAGPPAKSAGPAHASARLKDLYRAVVRRLHPDTQREMTAQKTEWWHQAQAAYEVGDAEQLEVILTLCDIGHNGSTAHTSASLLQRITAQLKSSLREIRRQLASRRRDPAWNFSQSANHDDLAQQMRHELMNDLERMRYQCRLIREMIARWKTAADQLKQPRRR